MNEQEQSGQKVGLSPEHRGELTDLWQLPDEVARHRFGQMRAAYAGDPLALQQIDFYDWDSPYHAAIRAWQKACGDGDLEQVTAREAWLFQHYPDLVAEQSLRIRARLT